MPTSTDSANWESTSSSSSSAVPTSTTNSSAAPASPLVAGKNQVIVAPMQGDLRMVPFNINVPENETITFIFGAGPHTVTQSSLLTICNASDAEGAFKSGRQEAGFQFPVVVTTNKTQSYYCGVPNHCEKGMFGLINGLNVAVPGDGFDDVIPKLTANNTELKSLYDETKKVCEGSEEAWAWGSTLQMGQFAPWSQDVAAENILYTRQYYAKNPSSLASANPANEKDDKGSSSHRSVETSSIALLAASVFAMTLFI
ncbi:hypothetical protein JCM5350_003672 [Sporobolomyces pararoseus]